jgi:DNA-binding transcriptional LysR family regulator
MEMHQVRYFLALCETLNFTRAAEKCNVTQPSLTRAIQALEEELGGPLLHREHNRTHLTDLGQLIRPYLHTLLDQSQAAKSRARDFVHLKDATISIGIMCTIGAQHMIGFMRMFRERYPGVDITLRDANANVLQGWLDDGTLDIAVLAFPDGTPERYHSLPLYGEKFVIAFAPGHPFERLNAVRLKDLHKHPYLVRINCEYMDYMLELKNQHGVESIRPYRSERDDWILSMAAAGLGYSFIPEHSVTVPGLLTRDLVEPEVSRTVTLVTVRGRPHSPVVGAFVRTASAHKWERAGTVAA